MQSTVSTKNTSFHSFFAFFTKKLSTKLKLLAAGVYASQTQHESFLDSKTTCAPDKLFEDVQNYISSFILNLEHGFMTLRAITVLLR